MSIFWFIYLLGFAVSLILVSNDFMNWCVKNRYDYREGFNDPMIVFMMIIESLGSWLTVGVCLLSRDNDMEI